MNLNNSTISLYRKYKFSKARSWGLFFGLSLAAIANSPAMAAGSDDFEYHGYFRSGTGTNDKGGDQVCLNNPGTPGNEFRLGNECDNYGELVFKAHHLKAREGKSGYFYSQIRLAYQQQGHSNWENSDPVFAREAFAEGGNFDGLPLVFWAGKRFYRENDVYMNDWYYFADMSANGGGVGQIPVGIGKAHVALLREVKTNKATRKGHLGVDVIDVRIKDIFLGHSRQSKLMLWAASGRSEGGEDQSNEQVHYSAAKGIASGVLWDLGLGHGSNQLALIYGQGLLDDLNIFGESYLPSGSAEADSQADSSRWRLVEHITYGLGKTFEFHAAAYGEQRDNGAKANSKETWYGVGIHPIYRLTEHFRLAGQAGHSVITADGATQRELTRLTLAPEVAVNASIWARPVVRFYLSHTSWNDANKGRVDQSGPYADETSATQYGVQTEVWF